MQKIKLVFDDWSHNELQEYLENLKGVIDVKLENEKYLEITIVYDNNLISFKTIKLEIDLFLKIKCPSLISFDKYSNKTLEKYSLVIKDLCCEFCLKSAIEDLLLVNGIEKALNDYELNYEKKENVVIDIYFDQKIISLDDIKILELKFNE